jgi:hypothetical protein
MRGREHKVHQRRGYTQIASASKNCSGIFARPNSLISNQSWYAYIYHVRIAESSRVLSNHWFANVWAAFAFLFCKSLPRAVIRSLLIGFLLKAIAEDPIWSASKGSSISVALLVFSTRDLYSPWIVGPISQVLLTLQVC